MTTMMLKSLIWCAAVLFSSTTKEVRGQCLTPPMNEAVYEGTESTTMECNSPTDVSWVIYSTDDELFPTQITNYSDYVTPSLANLYDVSNSNLIIKTAQSSPVVPNITTSGMYLAEDSSNNTDNKVAAKLVVVREGPSCDCTKINSTSSRLSCSVTYSDSSYSPIYAKMTWMADGNFSSTSLQSTRTRVNGTFTSMSTITTSDNDPATYQCYLTFSRPVNNGAPYIATNAPNFTASCTAICSDCPADLKNIAVFEGESNTLLATQVDSRNFSWKVVPTSDEFDTLTIKDFGSDLDPTFTGLYDVNETGLIIKDATTTGDPISTAGLYIGQCANGTSRTGAKLLVVRTGPQCSCVPTDQASTLSCNVTYGDSSYHPIYPIVTWKFNGTYLESQALSRKRIDPVFYAESTITDDTGSPGIYECELSFAEPTNIQFPFVATNAPDFKKSCFVEGCSLRTTSEPPATTTPSATECQYNLKNIAVREGESNTVMNLHAGAEDVSWKVIPTSDELDTLTIKNYTSGVDPTLTELYDVNQAGLIIKNATTTGDPISTAGLYIAQCANSTNKTGAKLLVVRDGPQCACVPSYYASNLSCSVTYADSSMHPIFPIVTWKLNGAYIETQTLSRKRIDASVFYAESNITDTNESPGYYECELTFAAPVSMQFPFVATNAPEFYQSCSIQGCSLTTTPVPPTTILPLTTDCNCTQPATCDSSVQNCSESSECGSDGTNMTDIYNECVVKAELYARSDKCCPRELVCGVVVTLRNDSRWLIHDPLCDDNSCQMVVVNATCMSSDWMLLAEKKIITSGVGDYVKAGNNALVGQSMDDCSESCKAMMNLP